MSTEAAHADDREAILQVERETMEAIRRRDVEALGRIVADDFVYRAPGRPDAGRAEFLHNIASIPVEVISVRGEGLHVLVHGETAVLTGVQRAEYRTGDGAAGVSSVAFADVLVKRGGRWLLVLAHGVELPDAT